MKDLECTRPFYMGRRQSPHLPLLLTGPPQTPLSLGERKHTEASEAAGGPVPGRMG